MSSSSAVSPSLGIASPGCDSVHLGQQHGCHQSLLFLGTFALCLFETKSHLFRIDGNFVGLKLVAFDLVV